MRGIVVLAGTSHREFADLLCTRLGIAAGPVILGRFANAEISVEIQTSVRDKDVFVLQTAAPPLNDNLMELLLMIHACKIASAARVTAVIPYIPYSRQINNPTEKPHANPLTERQAKLVADLQHAQSREEELVDGYRPWVARSGTLIANMITTAGADHVFTMDLHDPQFQGFFNIPVDNLPSIPLMIHYIRANLVPADASQSLVVISPDAGGAKRAAEVANLLTSDFALIHRNRLKLKIEAGVPLGKIAASTTEPNATDPPQTIDQRQFQQLVLVGSVRNRDALILDDLADTCETLRMAAAVLRKEGARKIYAVITHGVLTGEAIDQIESSQIDQLIVSNSIPQSEHLRRGGKLRIFDVSPIFAEAIRRSHNGESISCLFSPSAFLPNH